MKEFEQSGQQKRAHRENIQEFLLKRSKISEDPQKIYSKNP